MSGTPYRFQSENTKFYVISRPDDKAGQEVDTKDGKNSTPDESVLFTNHRIGHEPSVVDISGVHGLYVSLMRDAERTKLTWSNEKYLWIVTRITDHVFVITPANGADLYWFDEFNVGVGNHVEVRSGRDIKPPQNHWVVMAA